MLILYIDFAVSRALLVPVPNLVKEEGDASHPCFINNVVRQQRIIHVQLYMYACTSVVYILLFTERFNWCVRGFAAASPTGGHIVRLSCSGLQPTFWLFHRSPDISGLLMAWFPLRMPTTIAWVCSLCSVCVWNKLQIPDNRLRQPTGMYWMIYCDHLERRTAFV